jgi:plasmid maintenance system antidote protein VapI
VLTVHLARAFKTSPEFWLNLQQAFDLRTAERTVGSTVRGIKPIRRGHAG